MISKAKATNMVRSGEFDDLRLPVFVGGYDEGDGRVELPDGTLAYAIDDDAEGIRLCREAVAMDAGDNVHRRFKARERPLVGITAPTGAGGSGFSGERGQLTCIGDKQVGWLDSE